MTVISYCWVFRFSAARCLDTIRNKTPGVVLLTVLFKSAVFIFAAFFVIIHQTHNEKSDWSRAFNQFTITRELDMINAVQYSTVSVADITVPVKGLQHYTRV